MTIIKQIKDAAKEKKLLMGSRTVLKSIKNKNVDTVVFASNCPENVRKDLDHYSKISGIKMEEFNGNSVDLGEICGKPFRILMVGLGKGKK